MRTERHRTTAAALVLITAAIVFGAFHAVDRNSSEMADLIGLQPEALPASTPAAKLLPGMAARVAEHPRSANRHFMLAALEARYVRESSDETGLPRVEALLRRALELRPAYPEAHVALARALNQQHNFAAGAEAAEANLVDMPDNLASRAVLFDAYFGAGKYDQASTVLAALDPELSTPALLARRAQLAELYGDDDLAQRLLLAAARGARDQYQTRAAVAWYLYRLAEFYRLRGSYELAIDLASTAVRLAPDFLPALVTRAKLSLAVDGAAVALPRWETLGRRMPHPEILARLGDVYASVGRDRDATQAYTAALAAGAAGGAIEDRPMARLLADHGWSPDEALRRARRDLQLRQDLGAWDTLAWAAYRAGEMEEAAKAAAMALRFGTRRAEYHRHAGLIQRALGNDAAADEHFDAARRIIPRASASIAPCCKDLPGEGWTNQSRRRSRKGSASIPCCSSTASATSVTQWFSGSSRAISKNNSALLRCNQRSLGER